MVGHFHQPHRLAVTLRLCHAEIVLEPGFGGRPFLVSDHADALAAEAAEAADNRFIFAELAVARERHEILDQCADEIETMRPLRMARHLRLLPRRHRGVEIPQRLHRLGFEPADFLLDLHLVAAGLNGAKLLDLGIEFGDRFFKVEVTAHCCLGRVARGGRNWPCDAMQVKQTA